MAGLKNAAVYLWQRMRTSRRLARAGFKVGLIVLVCLVVLYSITRAVAFSVYGAKLDREMARFEAAGGTTDISSLTPPAGGRAPRLVMAAGLLIEEPGIPEPHATSREVERAAKEAEAWKSYRNWPGFSLHRTTPDGEMATTEWQKEWTQLLGSYVDGNATAISLAQEAARLGEGNFEIEWQAGYDADMRHLSRLRSCARLLRHAAIAAAAEGDIKAAAENVRLGFRLSRLIADEPAIISRLVAYACDGITFAALQGILEFGAPEADPLRALMAELEGREGSYGLVRPFILEIAVGLDAFDRVSRDPSYIGDLGSSDPRAERFRRPWPVDALLDFGIKLVWVEPADRYHYLRIMNDYIKAAQKGFPEKLEFRAPEFEGRWREAPFKVMTRMLTPALSKMYLQQAGLTTRVRLARCVIALTLYHIDHGVYPESLTALVPDYLDELQMDPFDGKPLRYERRDSGFAVYSVGQNTTDEGGVQDDHFGENGDIVWER